VVVQKITKEEFTAAIRWWMKRSEKCIGISGNYVEK
jgi:hypothetical protein